MAALAIAQDEHGWLSTGDDGLRRALPRHAAGRRLRGRDVLRDVQPEAGRDVQDHDLHEPAVRAAGRGRGRRAPEGKLGVGFDETTADGVFTLKEGECLGACGDAPVLLVNNKRMCSWMNAREARRARRRARGGGRARRGSAAGMEATRDERAVRVPRLRARRDPDGGPHRPQLAPRGLRRARRLRSAAARSSPRRSRPSR